MSIWPRNSSGVADRLALYLGILLGPERLPRHAERRGDVGGTLVAQQVDQHRGEAVHRIGGQAALGLEVLGGQRVERPERQRIAVQQHQSGFGVDRGVGGHTPPYAPGVTPGGGTGVNASGAPCGCRGRCGIGRRRTELTGADPIDRHVIRVLWVDEHRDRRARLYPRDVRLRHNLIEDGAVRGWCRRPAGVPGSAAPATC